MPSISNKWYFVFYLILILLAEVTTVYASPNTGILFHAVVLCVLFIHSGLISRKKMSENMLQWLFIRRKKKPSKLLQVFISEKQKLSSFLLALTLVPMIRILSLVMPLPYFSRVQWFLIIAIPIYLAYIVLVLQQKIDVRKIGIRIPELKHLPLEIGIILLAVPFGFMEYFVLRPDLLIDSLSLRNVIEAIFILLIATGFLEEIIFRMDLLHNLENLGMFVINPAKSIERSVDKYYALALLEKNGVPVPRTAVTESPEQALRCFHELGGDIVIKPLFGSRGIGSTRILDPNIAERIFRTISFYHGVLYLQEFIPHGFSDIRAFVIGNQVIASMRRVAKSWKTNVSLGAKPVAIKLNQELETLAVKAARVVGCKVSGVDILEGPDGPLVIELNSQPGWSGLQSVTPINIADKILEYILSELKA